MGEGGIEVGVAIKATVVVPVPLDTPEIRHDAVSVVDPAGPTPGHTVAEYGLVVSGLVTVAIVVLPVVKVTLLTVPELGFADTPQEVQAPPTVIVVGAVSVDTMHVGIGVGVGVGVGVRVGVEVGGMGVGVLVAVGEGVGVRVGDGVRVTVTGIEVGVGEVGEDIVRERLVTEERRSAGGSVVLTRLLSVVREGWKEKLTAVVPGWRAWKVRLARVWGEEFWKGAVTVWDMESKVTALNSKLPVWLAEVIMELALRGRKVFREVEEVAIGLTATSWRRVRSKVSEISAP